MGTVAMMIDLKPLVRGVAAICIGLPLCLHAAERLTFSPGPLDGVNIHTSWGDFVAVQEGNSIWVGTQAEYDHARVMGVLEQQGMIEVQGEGNAPNEHTIIRADSLRANVGGTQVYSVTTEILFGMPASKKLRRPPKPSGHEYVSLLWQQSQAGKVDATILDRESSTAYHPFDCVVDHGLHVCEYMVPSTALGRPAAFVFSLPSVAPAFLSVASIAQANYRSLREAVGEGHDRVEPSDEQKEEVRQLHAIDGKIPVEL